jgi:hypothetical protein
MIVRADGSSGAHDPHDEHADDAPDPQLVRTGTAGRSHAPTRRAHAGRPGRSNANDTAARSFHAVRGA